MRRCGFNASFPELQASYRMRPELDDPRVTHRTLDTSLQNKQNSLPLAIPDVDDPECLQSLRPDSFDRKKKCLTFRAFEYCTETPQGESCRTPFISSCCSETAGGGVPEHRRFVCRWTEASNARLNYRCERAKPVSVSFCC